jgi:hypothetical protein
MSFFEQLQNKISYTVHNIIYDPAAEQHAKEQKEKQEADIAAIEKAKKDKNEAALAAAQKKKADDEAAAAAEKEQERDTFDVGRGVTRTWNTMWAVVNYFLLLILALFGSSLAVNLNVYHDLPVKILYAIYGFLFFFLVIPYVIVYRWWGCGLRPRFYAVLPMIPYKINNYWLAFFFSWLSYKPDDEIEKLKEWLH